VNISRLRALGLKDKDKFAEKIKAKRSKMKRVSLGPSPLSTLSMIAKIEHTKNTTGIYKLA